MKKGGGGVGKKGGPVNKRRAPKPVAPKKITAPTSRGGLKRAMKAQRIKPPQGMVKPQAHHNLPWKHREWFAERGLNVNDPKFGRWVSGTQPGPHQKWTPRYGKEWDDFISKNPNATRKKVLDHLKKLLRSGKFPSK